MHRMVKVRRLALPSARSPAHGRQYGGSETRPHLLHNLVVQRGVVVLLASQAVGYSLPSVAALSFTAHAA